MLAQSGCRSCSWMRTCDECHDRLLRTAFFDEIGGGLFCRATDLTNHDDALRLPVQDSRRAHVSIRSYVVAGWYGQSAEKRRAGAEADQVAGPRALWCNCPAVMMSVLGTATAASAIRDAVRVQPPEQKFAEGKLLSTARTAPALLAFAGQPTAGPSALIIRCEPIQARVGMHNRATEGVPTKPQRWWYKHGTRSLHPRD